MAAIDVQCEGMIATTRVPTKMIFSTATDATPSVLTERLSIDSAGLVSIPGNLAVAGFLRGLSQELTTANLSATTGTVTVLTTAQVANTQINNYGQTGALTIPLPVCAAGMSFTCVIGTAGQGAISFDPNGSEVIYLDGLALAGGHTVTLATPLVGNAIQFSAFEHDAAVFSWMALTIVGLWVDGV